ncbi:hypothetical protein C823_007911 [Eubacterium plexicaudatum ASF492]|nr:hypothetical protein C823_007911 [Eubacterium plexicaudatum ASF492]
MAHGETKEEALKEIEIAKELWIETAKEDVYQFQNQHYLQA